MTIDALQAAPRTSLRPLVRLATPDHHYLAGEPITLMIHPPSAPGYEVQVRTGGKSHNHVLQGTNRLLWKSGLPIGSHTVRVRTCGEDDGSGRGDLSTWSIPLTVHVHPPELAAEVHQLRVLEHRASLMSERDAEGTTILTDPWAMPPAIQDDALKPLREGSWFRTAAYEGSTTLVNEVADYYRDPLAYFLLTIDEMITRGARFLTWHDVLDRGFAGGVGVILQLDVDAGRRSLARILPCLEQRGVTGTLMVHREAADWYDYMVDDMPLDLLIDAQRKGWAIGYHCNAIGNVQRTTRLGDYSDEVLSLAADRFRKDVAYLRSHFNIRTWTAHGGNVLNHLIHPPQDVDIQCVDKGKCSAWNSIVNMFSDGGFASRPGPFAQSMRSLKPGVNFVRIHPIKYGNYIRSWDVPPLDVRDVPVDGDSPTDDVCRWIDAEQEKQSRWLSLREQLRVSTRPSRMRATKPLSSAFGPLGDDLRLIERFRDRRKPAFLREYPHLLGDPRVFWWRLLRAFGPQSGEVLNIGALHPDQRDETTSFLSPSVRVFEMDIDPARSPHILGDITVPSPELSSRFAAVLLFGLPYVHSPGHAIDACAEVVSREGIGIFGFPDDSHPLRGSMWNARSRPVWSRDREPLSNIGLNANLWCFQEASLPTLMRSWTDVRIENVSHYWFVVARKPA